MQPLSNATLVAVFAFALLAAACGGGEGISVPQGFAAETVVEGLEFPTSIALGPDGGIYASQLDGTILRLEDGDGDGVYESKAVYAEDLVGANGIAFGLDDELYVSSRGRVTVVSDGVTDIITGLPSGAHQNNGLAFGPDGKLYITNGSTCNECTEEDERSATILRANPDGSELEVHATGLRNPYGIAFDPEGRLWATDNGSDPPCNTIDELNLIMPGGDYGWPYEPACDALISGTPPAVNLEYNTGSTGLAFYDGQQFPSEYQGNAFVTLWGSNVEAPEPNGRYLARVVIDEDGPAPTMDRFAEGFQNPIDVAVDDAGALLVLDFGAGEVIRITHTG